MEPSFSSLDIWDFTYILHAGVRIRWSEMFVFWKRWRALFPCNKHFVIHLFVLLPTKNFIFKYSFFLVQKILDVKLKKKVEQARFGHIELQKVKYF